ncbi:uncharacterized protein LOC124371605 [Homalodisca vitripennis]|uniref:uncharacterized protein LOC124371605 n=1 Tax=Homalodisca vitripennis TaxID=197043 RepID=UPI001EECDC53|nr:uncharacterized protein LOC124371605 [Homalodisca vitripennis]
MGDINVDILEPDRNTAKLNEMLAYHNIQRVDLPATRITPISKSSIDWIASNMITEALDISVFNTGLSDHTAQKCTITNLEEIKTPKSVHRAIGGRNLDELKWLLINERWEKVYTSLNSEEAYNNYRTTVTIALDTACPLKTARTKKTKPKHFADAEALILKNDYLAYLNQFETTGNLADRIKATDLKKKYDQRLKTLRSQRIADQITNSQNKSKTIWETINSVRSKKQDTLPQLKLTINGQLIEDTYAVAEQFNDYFANIAKYTIDRNNGTARRPVELPGGTHTSELRSLRPTTQEELRSIIKSLKSKNSAGIDDISTKVLKHCAEELICPLTDIFNKSFNEGHVPSALKISKIYPKFKTGSRTELSNYRPISLLPTVAKLCEKVVLTRLLEHCTLNNLITSSQHGFVKGKSTTTAMIELLESVIDSLENGNLTTAIFLDFSKAFDCLGHDLILKKLNALGVTATALKWFESYLKDRSQVVEIKSTVKGTTKAFRSQPLPIQRGVPQGSVLGPVLFILFTNDLPEYLSEYTKTLMYADDTTLILDNHSPENLCLNAYIAVNMAYQYCDGNDLVVNPSKTSQLGFGRRSGQINSLPEVNLVDQTKFLGVLVDSNLSWTPHIDQLCNRLNSSLYALKQIKAIGDLTTARTAYFALFETHIRYGLAVWGGTSKTNMNRILILQKKAIRILANLHPLESCREAFPTLNILTVTALYIQELVMYVDGENLTRLEDIHYYNTRNSTMYQLPTHHLTQYEKKPTYMGRKLSNCLPTEIRTKKGKELKTALWKLLSQRAIYTLQEFYLDVSNHQTNHEF